MSKRTPFVTESEAKVAAILDRFGVRWFYEPIRFYRGPGCHGPSCRPDFFIPEWNLFVEVKWKHAGRSTLKYRDLICKHGFRFIKVMGAWDEGRIEGTIAAAAFGLNFIQDVVAEEIHRDPTVKKRIGRRRLRKQMAAVLEDRIKRAKAIIRKGPTPRLSRVVPNRPYVRGGMHHQAEWQRALEVLAAREGAAS